MPQVPSPTAPSISPSGIDTPYQSATGATPEAFGANIGQQLERTGDVLAKHALQFQDRENQAAATDLYTQAAIDVGKLDAEYGSRQGKARVDAFPQYQKDMLAIQEKYRGMAGNVDVQHQFDNDFKRRMAYSIIDEAKKSATALKDYNNKSQAARVTLAQQDTIANAKDDGRFELNLKETEIAAKATAHENNWGPEEAEVYRRARIDSLYETRLKALSITDPFRAQTIYKRDKDKILDGNVQLRIENDINQGIIRGGSKIDAETIWSAPNQAVTDRVKKFEGLKLRAYPDYKQFSIGYGTKATSPDEVIDKPEAERRFGVEFGKAQDFVETVNPNLDQGTKDALSSLTFNAGTKWADSGLGQAVRSGDLNAIKERLLQYNQAGGIPNAALIARREAEAQWIGREIPQNEKSNVDRYSDALTKAKEFAEKRFPDDPGSQAQYQAALESRIGTLYNTDRRVQSEQKRNRKFSVMGELLNPSITNFDQLSPQAQTSYSDMSPPEQRQMNHIMEENAKGIVQDTPQRRANFETFWGQLKLSPDQFEKSGWENADLSTRGRSQLFKEWTAAQKTLGGDTHLRRALANVRGMLNDARPAIGESATDPVKNDRMNQFAGAFDQKLTQYIDEHKRFPNEKEQREMAAGLLVERRENYFFANPLAFEVPSAFSAEWIPKMTQRMGRPPKPGELAAFYQFKQGRNPPPTPVEPE